MTLQLMDFCFCSRVSVMRGQVITPQGLGIVGIRVSVDKDSRFGFTLTRTGGWWVQMNEFYIYTATVDRSSWKVSLKRRRFISSLNRLYLVYDCELKHKLSSALHIMMFIAFASSLVSSLLPLPKGNKFYSCKMRSHLCMRTSLRRKRERRKEISQTRVMKILGIHLDRRLTFRNHIDEFL